MNTFGIIYMARDSVPTLTGYLKHFPCGPGGY